jgi:hypothetical protein
MISSGFMDQADTLKGQICAVGMAGFAQLWREVQKARIDSMMKGN